MENFEVAKKHVVVFVRGGVAEYISDSGVNVVILDYDNDSNIDIPENVRHLVPK